MAKCNYQSQADSSEVENFIDTGSSRPVFSRPRQLRPKLLAVAKEEFKKLMQQEIIAAAHGEESG